MSPTPLLTLFLAVPALVLAQADCPTLAWADEFDGDTLDLASWSYQLGDGTEFGIPGWGNNERQYYQRENAEVVDGELVITARAEEVGGYPYTSARILTKEKVDFTYGTVVARAKVPAGGGTWPAIWMLSTGEPYGTWPKSGEIDIMEYIGNDPTELLGTVHYGEDFPNNSFTSRRLESLTGPLSDEYHEYRVDWMRDSIRWVYDGYRYGAVTREEVEARGLRWPFDDDFHLLLNLAVGGNLGGAVAPADYPAEFRVDYVRVYEGQLPYVTGPREVSADEPIARYSVHGPSIVLDYEFDLSGVGADSVFAYDFADDLDDPCGSFDLALQVDVLAEAAVAKTRVATIENFDSARAPIILSTGELEIVADPVPDDTLAEGQIGRYTRNAGEAFDVIFYDVSGVDALDAAALVAGTQTFSLDLRTAAPAGTEIILQLESAAASEGYPTGRHSRYGATVPEGITEGFARLEFAFLDRPDPSVAAADVEQLAVLFAPSVASGDVYEYDNLDVYGEVGNDDDEGDDNEDDGEVAGPSLDSLEEAYAIVDFDDASATLTFASGTLDTLVAAEADGQLVEGSFGSYTRDAGSAFDVLVFDVTGVDSLDPAALEAGEQVLALNLRTGAPAGTEILAQLETPDATGDYPAGRFARLRAVVPEGATDSFARVSFGYLDRPDPAATTTAEAVSQLVLLFAPNTNTGDVYAFDQLVAYGPPDTTTTSVVDGARVVGRLRVGVDRAGGRIAVDLPDASAGARERGRLSLVDMAGRELRRWRVPAGGGDRVGLDVAGLRPGGYVLRYVAGGRAWMGRFAW